MSEILYNLKYKLKIANTKTCCHNLLIVNFLNEYIYMYLDIYTHTHTAIYIIYIKLNL